MVCQRCILAVEQVLNSNGIAFDEVTMDEIDAAPLSGTDMEKLRKDLQQLGFEFLETRVNKIIQRSEKIKEQLIYKQQSLTEIACNTGFSSVHHLSAQFKKLTGLTPSYFRSMGSA